MDAEFVPGDVERSFSIGPVPIREGTALNVGGNSLICLTHRIRAEISKAPLHDGFVFFCSSCLAIVGCEFGKIRAGDDNAKASVSNERSWPKPQPIHLEDPDEGRQKPGFELNPKEAELRYRRRMADSSGIPTNRQVS